VRLAAVLLICAAVATMMIISPWMVRGRKKHRAARDAENRVAVQEFELDQRKTFQYLAPAFTSPNQTFLLLLPFSPLNPFFVLW